MKISSKRQISVPKKIMEALGLRPGDEVEFELDGNGARLIPVQTIKVPREQAWFWSAEWQAKEMQAEQELADGRFGEFDNLQELLKDLHSED